MLHVIWLPIIQFTFQIHQIQPIPRNIAILEAPSCPIASYIYFATSIFRLESLQIRPIEIHHGERVQRMMYWIRVNSLGSLVRSPH